MTRPTWQETWLDVAETVAKRSLCIRARVGAVVVDPTNQHVITGYNGPPAGFRHGNEPCNVWCRRAGALAPSPDYSDCPVIHAEANALLKSDYTVRKGGTIYVTSHICWGCAKLIANSGLSTVVVRSASTDLHRNPLASYAFLLECGLNVVLPGSDMMSLARMANV